MKTHAVAMSRRYRHGRRLGSARGVRHLRSLGRQHRRWGSGSTGRGVNMEAAAGFRRAHPARRFGPPCDVPPRGLRDWAGWFEERFRQCHGRPDGPRWSRTGGRTGTATSRPCRPPFHPTACSCSASSETRRWNCAGSRVSAAMRPGTMSGKSRARARGQGRRAMDTPRGAEPGAPGGPRGGKTDPATAMTASTRSPTPRPAQFIDDGCCEMRRRDPPGRELLLAHPSVSRSSCVGCDRRTVHPQHAATYPVHMGCHLPKLRGDPLAVGIYDHVTASTDRRSPHVTLRAGRISP